MTIGTISENAAWDRIQHIVRQNPSSAKMKKNRVYISIGSNDRPEENLCDCLALLHSYCRVVAASHVHETRPAGECPSPVNFLNAVVVVETDLDPRQLKETVLRVIERRLGRQSAAPGKPCRIPIDLDILLFNDEQYDLGKRHIPEPDIYKYAYIAIPLADVAPDYVHPVTGDRLRDVARPFLNCPEVLAREDIRLPYPQV